MPNWDHAQSLEDDRNAEQRSALSMPFGAQLDAFSIETEAGLFSHQGNEAQKLTINHPFLSQGAWIRAIPEGGTNYIMQFRMDEAKPYLMGTVSRGATDKISNYRGSTSMYRPLYPGEIDIMSSGVGQIFMSRRPAIDVYGGTIRRWADQDKLVAADRAPLHLRQGLQYRSNTLGDEERFGIVSRPKENVDGTFSSWEKNYPKVRNEYAAEHYLQLRNPGNAEPDILFRKQSGHVLDLEGGPITHSKTGNALRHVEEYFANDDSNTLIEVDESGNYAVSLATDARFGYNLDIPSGGYFRNIELDENAFINKDMNYSIAGNTIYQIGGNLRFNAGGLFELASRSGGQRLQFSNEAGETKTALTTGGGHAFILDDTSGNETINLYHVKGSFFTIDKDGSVKCNGSDGSHIFLDTLSRTATMTSGSGTYLSMGPAVNLVSPNQAVLMNGTTTLQLQSNQNILATAPKLDIQCGSIALGAFASLSVALAEPLAVLFDSHFHATPVGPSGPPLPPNTAALFNANPLTSFASANVKIKGNLI